MSNNDKNTKICLVTSPGGHLTKMIQLKDWWGKYDRFFVSRNDSLTTEILKGEPIYRAYFPENRNYFNLIRNLFLAFKVLIIEKPTHVFSLGAGVAIPYIILGRLMGKKVIFMDTFITIPRITWTGKMAYYFAHHFIVQNKELARKYKKSIYWGSLL